MSESETNEGESVASALRADPAEATVDALAEELARIMDRVRGRIVSDSRLQDLLRGNETLASSDDNRRQAPEEFTKRLIIDEVLEYLDYPYRHEEVNTPSDDEDQWVDYSIPLDHYPNIDSTQLLIEAEPINKNLDRRDHGVGQVRRWLHHEPFESNLGIATDGVRWILLKKDPDTHAINRVEDCDLTDVLIALFDAVSTGGFNVETDLGDEERRTLKTFYGVFAFDNLTEIAPGMQALIRKTKKEVSEAFYQEYIEIVFGIIDEDEEGRDTERCLVGDGITPPPGTSDGDKRLFAVQLMNRLLFIKFVEDTEIVADDLLEDIRTRHTEGGHLSDCYTTFLKPLIYDVFNTPRQTRPDQVRSDPLFNHIPYLNGGLFRKNLDSEGEYRVSDSVLLQILDMIEQYNFTVTGSPAELDPSVLGTVFEKTINYLAGEAGAQKDLGAFYTPDSITQYCALRTVNSDLLDRFKQVLAAEWGWRSVELDRYDDVYNLIEALTPNQDLIKDLLSEVDSFRILDPACGSGHFLTSVMNKIVPIRRALYKQYGDVPRLHQVKKETILKNLYGVDIVGPGVEITKLRLWLSIMSEISIEDVEELERGELALPNIAFNIREGNSLLGYTDKNRLQVEEDADIGHQQSMIAEFGEESVRRLVEERQERINQYKRLYGEEAHEIEAEIDERDDYYNRQLNRKLVEDLRDAEVTVDYKTETVEVPTVEDEAIGGVKISLKPPLGDEQKKALEERFRTHTGLRINPGTGGIVSLTMNNDYLTGTPKSRLSNIIAEVESNVATIEVSRYLTVEDVEEVGYLHWPLEFYQVFSDGGFDVVIGNPPYGIKLAQAESALGSYLDENHSSMVFSTRSESLANANGRIAFVVPKALTYAYRWKDARSHLLKQNLDYLIDLREAFEGVKQEQIVLMYSKRAAENNTIVVGRRETDSGDDRFFEQEYQQTALDTDVFFMWVDDNNKELLTKLGSYDTFADREFATATKGMDNFKSSLTGDPDDLIAYRGDDVGQFRFVGRSYIDPSVQDRSDFHDTGYGEEKVVFQRILAHVTDPVDRIVIQCAIDYDGRCVTDTAIHATPREGSAALLCGLLNSSLFAWYAYNQIYNRAIRSMDLTPAYFGRFPAPPKTDDDLVQVIEDRVANICELDGDGNILKEYEQLDQAVYDLYDLTSAERAVIDAEVPPREETLLEKNTDWTSL